MGRLRFLFRPVAALLAVPVVAAAQMPKDMKAVSGTKLEWVDPGVPGFDPGMMLAPVLGDPSVADQPYVLRLKFPDGYRFPAHFHPKAEHLTVLSGSLLLTMGRQESENLTTYAPGDYLYIPPEMPHFGGAKGETVIQLHGMGPFEIKLVKPVSGGTR